MLETSTVAKQIKCARYDGPGRIVVANIERPICPPDCVLIEVKWAGICGSDLVVYRGARAQPANPPGHEFSGVIVEVGTEVENFVVGDRVCAESFSHCGSCYYCTQGAYNLCSNREYMPSRGPSGFSEIAVVPSSSLHRLPQAVDFELGALVEPLAVGLHALDRIVDQPVHRLLIVGAGTIGLATLLSAKARHIEDVWVVAKHPQQAELAHRFRATEVLEPSCDLLASIAGSVDAVVTTSTSGEALSQAIRICRSRGTVVLTSAYTSDTTVQFRPVVSEEVYLAGSIAYSQSGNLPDFEAIIGWLAEKTFCARPLITHRFPLDDIATAFRVAQDKKSGSVKVLIQVDEQL